MRTGILLLARTGSTRLPGKLLKNVMGRPILEYQIERLKTARRPDVFVLCTTKLRADDRLVELARQNDLEVFRGSNEDPLDRMMNAAEEHHLDLLLCIGGDDVLIEADCVDTIIERFEETQADYIYCPGLPIGCTPFGIKTDALKRLSRIRIGGLDGWERYFTETGLFQVEEVEMKDPANRRPELRMTLDYAADFEFFKTVFELLYPNDRNFQLKDVIRLVDSRPDVYELLETHSEEWKNKHHSFDIRVSKEC